MRKTAVYPDDKIIEGFFVDMIERLQFNGKSGYQLLVDY